MMQKLSSMMKLIMQWLAFTIIAIFFSIHSASAGMPGSFRLVFMDISQSPYQDGQALMIKLRKLDGRKPGDDFQNSKPVDEDYRSGDCFSCQGGIDDYNSIGMIYLYSIPVGLTVADARQAVAGNAEARIMPRSINRAIKAR